MSASPRREDLEFRLSSNDGVTLNVVDARDGRAISARATAYDMQGRIVDETRMSFGGGDSGSIKLSVSPGSYTATVSAGGYASRNVSFQSPSDADRGALARRHAAGALEAQQPRPASASSTRTDFPTGASATPSPRASSSPLRAPRPSPTSPPAPTRCSCSTDEAVVDSKRIVVQEGQTVTEEI